MTPAHLETLSALLRENGVTEESAKQEAKTGPAAKRKAHREGTTWNSVANCPRV
jgi:hypothetical protein